MKIMGKQKSVCLDPGHGGKDGGAHSPKGYREADFVLRVHLLARKILIGRGVKVYMTRETDKFVSLNTRSWKANSWKVDLFVSGHLNSATRKSAQGIETFSMTGSIAGKKLASHLQGSVTEVLPGLTDRGVKEKNLSVLRKTRMPAALIEYFFIQNAEGEAMFTDSAVEAMCALATADGICDALKVDYIDVFGGDVVAGVISDIKKVMDSVDRPAVIGTAIFDKETDRKISALKNIVDALEAQLDEALDEVVAQKALVASYRSKMTQIKAAL